MGGSCGFAALQQGWRSDIASMPISNMDALNFDQMNID
jgi:hypothetical protein